MGAPTCERRGGKAERNGVLAHPRVRPQYRQGSWKRRFPRPSCFWRYRAPLVGAFATLDSNLGVSFKQSVLFIQQQNSVYRGYSGFESANPRKSFVPQKSNCVLWFSWECVVIGRRDLWWSQCVLSENSLWWSCGVSQIQFECCFRLLWPWYKRITFELSSSKPRSTFIRYITSMSCEHTKCRVNVCENFVRFVYILRLGVH